MTYMDDHIAKVGQSVAIWRKSEGAVDGYGDAAPTWALTATETGIIQKAGRGSLFDRAAGVAGRIDPGEYLGLFASDSVVAEMDEARQGALKYSVEKAKPVLEQGQTSHVEALLRIMEDA